LAVFASHRDVLQFEVVEQMDKETHASIGCPADTFNCWWIRERISLSLRHIEDCADTETLDDDVLSVLLRDCCLVLKRNEDLDSLLALLDLAP
jgi:hypothetical protein